MAVSPGKNLILSNHSKKPLADRPEQERFFGRRKGRPLNKQRRQALNLLDQFGIHEDFIQEDASLHPNALFGQDYTKFHLEIGFGNGEFFQNMVQNHPEDGFIGAEPFLNGVAALLKNIQDTKPDNLRVWADDVRPLLRSFKGQCFETVYILNPDPWPKKKHHKRRIVNPSTLDEIARLLKPNGRLVMTTDVNDLAEWMATQTVNHPAFCWDIKSPCDATEKPDNWLSTRYELKGAEAGRDQYYLMAIKRA